MPKTTARTTARTTTRTTTPRRATARDATKLRGTLSISVYENDMLQLSFTMPGAVPAEVTKPMLAIANDAIAFIASRGPEMDPGTFAVVAQSAAKLVDAAGARLAERDAQPGVTDPFIADLERELAARGIHFQDVASGPPAAPAGVCPSCGTGGAPGAACGGCGHTIVAGA